MGRGGGVVVICLYFQVNFNQGDQSTRGFGSSYKLFFSFLFFFSLCVNCLFLITTPEYKMESPPPLICSLQSVVHTPIPPSSPSPHNCPSFCPSFCGQRDGCCVCDKIQNPIKKVKKKKKIYFAYPAYPHPYLLVWLLPNQTKGR